MTATKSWVQTAARRLGVTEGTIRRWIRTGRLNPTCRKVYVLVMPYLDRELGPDDLAAVEGHLAACSGCEQHFRFDGDVLRFVKQRVPRSLLTDDDQERLLAPFRGQPPATE